MNAAFSPSSSFIQSVIAPSLSGYAAPNSAQIKVDGIKNRKAATIQIKILPAPYLPANANHLSPRIPRTIH